MSPPADAASRTPTATPPRRPSEPLRSPPLVALRDAWRAPPRPPESPFRRHHSALERALGCSPTPGNRAELLIDGPATHAAMFDAIAAARDHVNIES